MTILGVYKFNVGGLMADNHALFPCDTIIFSDGKISIPGSNGNSTLIDSAPKLQTLEVVVHKADRSKLYSSVVIGFAGTSALVALSATAFIAKVLSSLCGEELPSVDQICKFCSGVFAEALREYSQNQLTSANAALLVGGYDLSLKRSAVKSVKFFARDGDYKFDEDWCEKPLTLLSQPSVWDLEGRLDRVHAESCEFDSVDKVHLIVSEVDMAIRAISSHQPYGGQLQIATIGTDGAQLHPTKYWDFEYKRSDLPEEYSEGDYRTTLLGYDIFDLRVGQCDFRTHVAMHLLESHGTAWAKRSLPAEPRASDDGDFFSRPRSGLLNIQIKKDAK